MNGLSYLSTLEERVFASADKSEELKGSILADRLTPTCLLDALFIDVDCKDTRLGVTAPPPAFVTEAVFGRIHRLLDDEGILVLNVAARVDAYVTEIITRLAAHFAQVYKLQPSEENLNIVLIGIKHSLALDVAQREALLSKWLKVSRSIYYYKVKIVILVAVGR